MVSEQGIILKGWVNSLSLQQFRVVILKLLEITVE